MAIKTWQLDVTYKGVPFFVDSTDDELNRRGAHHQYPQRDKGTFEDLGKDDPNYNLSGYVTELSPGGYEQARDNLIKACTEGGLGDLVHPYFGTKQVHCVGCRVMHSHTENGVARFALSFLEADEPGAPVKVDNSVAKIHAAADASLLASMNDFAERWNIANVPSYVREAGIELVQDVGNALSTIINPLNAITDSASIFVDGAASLLGVAREAIDNPKSFCMRLLQDIGGPLVGDGLHLGKQIAGLGRLVPVVSGNEAESYHAYTALESIGQPTSPTGKRWATVPNHTHNRAIQANNQEALQELVQRLAVIESIRMTPYMPLDNRGEAIQLRETLTEKLDALTLVAPDTVYKSLESLRAAFVADITKRGPELGRIGQHVVNTTRPALVVAYELYHNIGAEADKATEISARNNIRHPGFIQGGQVLEVRLND